jgi:hypothetical protein
MENPEGSVAFTSGREYPPLPTSPVIKEKEDKISVFQISIIFILAIALIGAGIFINQNKFKSDVVCEAENITIPACPINNLTCEKQVCSCPEVNVSCNFPNNININVKNSS